MSGGGIPITRAEAYEAVMAGADNVMCLEYYDHGCSDHCDNQCWVGVQRGDEDENGEWPEHWKTFELW
jgi:hypothetical protein